MPPFLLPKFFLISLLSAIICATNFTHSYSQCLDDQRSSLLELKKELIFNSSLSAKLVKWNETDECCSWHGVECDGAGYVTSLQLYNEAISGGIGDSSSLFKLKYLKKLNLAGNDFNFTQIPRGIQNLSYLTHLDLADANFGGQVPLELSSLRRLVSLDISNILLFPIFSRFLNLKPEPLKLEFPNLEMLVKNLTGLRELYLDSVNISSQKSEWSHIISSYLPDLVNLSLCYCSVSGPIDRSLSQLRSLSVLLLEGNNLGLVPDFFNNFSSLTTLSLTNCSLKGSLPEMIFHIPTLQNLDLSDNQLLSGRIPSFPQEGSLKTLALSRTNLSGSLPSSISNLKTLSDLDLSSCKFTGHIPSTLANLTELYFLDLSDNFFTGSLSSTLFGGLSKLLYLILDSNSFTGTIPHSLFSHPSLWELSLTDNQFTGQVEGFPTGNVSNIYALFLSGNRLEGPFPDSLFQLQSLEDLSISHNLFNDTFQLEKFLSLPNLKGLDLSYNNLSVDINKMNTSLYGFIPLHYLALASCNLYNIPEFINHSDIYDLDLSSNKIAGELPSWIWRTGARRLNFSSNLLTGVQKPFHIPTSLYILDLSSNQLQGELHLPIPSVSALQFLSIANNSLSGSIPTSLCIATSLLFLDLSLNKLSGNIPPCLLQNSVNLEVFNLFRNNISGHIPDMFPLHCSLRTLDLHKNTLQGKIPKSLESCKSLEFVNVGNNIINDTFPCMLSSNLRVLVLRSNRFHGEVRCRQSLPNLQIVDISSNDFSGSLESINFSSWSAMKLESDPQLNNHSFSNFLQAGQALLLQAFNYPVGVTLTMKGLELNIVKIWPDFIAIDFSCNNFQGEIPHAICNLSSLHLLNLSHNALHGGIPMLFGKLGQLESLDLSQNQLTGRIPVELAGLTFLSFLNLSYNKLVGVIPNGRQFQTFSVDSFKGNPGLCGFPLNINCSNTDGNDIHENVDSEREIEWEYVSAALGYVVGLGSIVWLILFCRSFRDKYFDKVEEVVEEIFDGRNRRRRRARRTVRNQGRRQQ